MKKYVCIFKKLYARYYITSVPVSLVAVLIYVTFSDIILFKYSAAHLQPERSFEGRQSDTVFFDSTSESRCKEVANIPWWFEIRHMISPLFFASV